MSDWCHTADRHPGVESDKVCIGSFHWRDLKECSELSDVDAMGATSHHEHWLIFRVEHQTVGDRADWTTQLLRGLGSGSGSVGKLDDLAIRTEHAKLFRDALHGWMIQHHGRTVSVGVVTPTETVSGGFYRRGMVKPPEFIRTAGVTQRGRHWFDVMLDGIPAEVLVRHPSPHGADPLA